MSGFPILDLVVGVIFIYFLLSIICSSVVEVILTFFKIRASLLTKWLMTIFSKGDFFKEIMNHCGVTVLSGNKLSTSYISARNFVTVLIERITFDPAKETWVAQQLDDIVAAIEKTDLLPTQLKRQFLSYAVEAKEDYNKAEHKVISQIDLFQIKMENWYDSNMERLTGSLKHKYSRPFTFFVAAIFVIPLNADTITISRYLYSNPDARVKIAAAAYTATTDTILKQKVDLIKTGAGKNDTIILNNIQEIQDTLAARIQDVNRQKEALEDLMPFGWSEENKRPANGQSMRAFWSLKIAGLLATMFAILMGAPFWFDILNKISNIRGTGARPPVTQDDNKIRTSA